MFTIEFWRDALERAIATFAQTIIALAGVNISDAISLDWVAILIAGLIAAGLSILKGLAASKLGNQTNPSLTQKYDYPEDTDTR